jgi:hypothetical protein
MANQNSPVPTRFPQGVSTDWPYGPLANYGLPNPFTYHTVYDDFDDLLSASAKWLVYGANSGTVASSDALTGGNGEGGQILFTTGATSGNASSIELNKATFILPPASSTGLAFQCKKCFFATRLWLTTPASTTFVAGLVNASATPSATITDGIYISATSLTSMNMYAYSGSTLQWTVPIPAAVLTAYYAAAKWIDIGFYMTRDQNVYAQVGFPLFGYNPQQNWSGTNNVNAAPVPKANVAAYQVGVSGAWTPTTALLTPAIIIQTSSNAAKTAYADFIFAAKER